MGDSLHALKRNSGFNIFINILWSFNLLNSQGAGYILDAYFISTNEPLSELRKYFLNRHN